MKIIPSFIRAFSKKLNRPFCSAVVPAAGSSQRMGGINKLFLELDGIPVIARTLSALQSSELIDEIVLVTREEDLVPVAELCKKYDIAKATSIVLGGAERSESVFIGITNVSHKAKLIAVHDGDRPLITKELINSAVKAAAEYHAAAVGIPVTDTLKTVKDGFIRATVDRSSTAAIQTPQVFDADLIKGAMARAANLKLKITDECMAVEAAGVSPKIVEGSWQNIKITTPRDLLVAEAILKKRKESV